MKQDLITIIERRFPKNGWSFIRTRKLRPLGYVGYILTIYDIKDDVTPIHNIRGRNMKSILKRFSSLE